MHLGNTFIEQRSRCDRKNYTVRLYILGKWRTGIFWFDRYPSGEPGAMRAAKRWRKKVLAEYPDTLESNLKLWNSPRKSRRLKKTKHASVFLCSTVIIRKDHKETKLSYLVKYRSRRNGGVAHLERQFPYNSAFPGHRQKQWRAAIAHADKHKFD